jgi:predicted PurR-regulated permease PerM
VASGLLEKPDGAPTAGASERNDLVAGPEPVSIQTPVNIQSVALSLVAAAAAIVLLRYMQSVIIPFVLAALIFYALDPAVDRMQRWGLPRAIGAGLMIGLFVASILGLAYALEGEVIRTVDRLPQAVRSVQRMMRQDKGDGGALSKIRAAAKEIEASTSEPPAAPVDRSVARVQVAEPAFNASDYLWAGSLGVLNAVNNGIMILFLTYFMLLTDELFKRKLVEIAGPTLSDKKITVKILDDIAGQVERFLVIQVVTSCVVGVATWLALWAMGLREAALWGFFAGLFNSIPYYGPLIVTGGLSAVAFLQFGTFSMTGAVAGVALLITTLEGSLLTPALLGRVAQMNKVAVFAGLLFWSWMWGITGMLLAIPMMMIIKAVCDRVDGLQPVGQLLGE